MKQHNLVIMKVRLVKSQNGIG